MKTLKQHILEKLKINKNFTNIAVIPDNVKELFKKYNIKYNKKTTQEKNSVVYNSKNDKETYEAFLYEFYNVISNNAKEIEFPFKTINTLTIPYSEVTNKKNIAIITIINNDQCNSIWIMGKDYNQYVCFSKNTGQARISIIDEYIPVYFNDVSAIKTYELDDNIVDDIIVLIKEY